MSDVLKVLTVFGTRPEAIKMAPLCLELGRATGIESRVCVTAQHREMLDQVLDLFQVKPDFDLNIMKVRQSLTGITCRVLEGMEDIFRDYQPDVVLVHGDTTTSTASALAAFYQQIKVGHVEAGLRTRNKYAPFPEEMNRTLTGDIADLHFSPTASARRNLLREGVAEESIYVTGNTVIDAMSTTVAKDYTFRTEALNNIDYKNRKVILVTAHRRENWGEGLDNICKSLRDMVIAQPDIELIYLVHLNPLVVETANKFLKGVERVHLLPPLDTQETHNLMSKCYMVMTDSGGLQEEAPHLGKPVLVFRDETERPEAVEAGTVKLVGTDPERIKREAYRLLTDKAAYTQMSQSTNPYGDGQASQRIVQALMYAFKRTSVRPEDFQG